MNNSLLSFVCVLFVSTAWAEDSYWLCTTVDNQDKQWVAKHPYDRVALNRAFDDCKKQSKNPLSCKASIENCDYFSNGLSTKPSWRCMALDQMSKPWLSNNHPKRDDAAIEAKAYCEQRSGMPETCYINLLTCKNLNERS